MKPRVLFVGPRRPWERRSGSEVIIADLLEALLEKDEVDVLPAFCRGDGSGEGSAPAEVDREIVLGASLRPRGLSVLEALLRGGLPQQYRYRESPAGRIRSHLPSNWKPDLIHVEHLQLLDAGIHLSHEYDAPLVFRPHNVEAARWAQHLSDALPNLLAPVTDVVYRLMLGRELSLTQQADLCLPISIRDREIFDRSSSLECVVLSPSVDEERIGQQTDRIERVPTVGFVGSMEYRPNRRGLRWFLSEVWDPLQDAVPEAKLELVSRGAEDQPFVRQRPAVQVHEEPCPPGVLFARSWASVVPILDGGGTKIKGVESLMAGCPVVATPEGSAGLDVEGETGVTVCDNAAAFVDSLRSRLGKQPNPTDRHLLSRSARERYGAQSVADRLLSSWRRLST